MVGFNTPEQDKKPSRVFDAEYYDQHRLSERVSNFLLSVTMRVVMGPKSDRPRGLTRGSIISERILHPLPDQGVEWSQAPSGMWLAYDFRRPDSWPQISCEAPKRLFTGKLVSFMLNEVTGQPGSKLTPSHLVDFGNIRHILCFDRPTLNELVQEELVCPTTHENAYKTVGMYEAYADTLHTRGVADDQVHQVTPKGNMLIYMTPDGGDRTPKPDTEPAVAPLRGWQGLSPEATG